MTTATCLIDATYGRKSFENACITITSPSGKKVEVYLKDLKGSESALFYGCLNSIKDGKIELSYDTMQLFALRGKFIK